jgi:phospholipid/cholesterol/gamma-HCH transport system substrate-binding protein
MKREIKVGLFVVVMLLLGWGVIKYLKGVNVFSTSNTYYAYYDQAGGLQPASAVMINGVKIGSVANVTLDEDPSKGVEVELLVDECYHIPVDSKAKIINEGIMSGKAVEIIYGKSTEMVPDKGRIEGVKTVDLMALAGSEMEDMLAKVTTIMNNLTVTLESVNALLAQNTEGFNNIVSNVDSITGNANEMLAKERVHLEETLSSLSIFAKGLGENTEQIDSLIGNLNAFSAQLAQSNLVAEVEGAVARLNTVLASVSDKDGSVGKLLSDDELYENLTAASDNLSALLADLKENPSRYINVSVFGGNPQKKVERAKAKAEKKAIKRADELAEAEAKAIKESLESSK